MGLAGAGDTGNPAPVASAMTQIRPFACHSNYRLAGAAVQASPKRHHRFRHGRQFVAMGGQKVEGRVGQTSPLECLGKATKKAGPRQ